MRKRLNVLTALALSLAALPAAASSFTSSPFGGGSAYSPAVPVSAFARPAAWFDPQRLRISTTVSVGGGWGYGTSALQVTRLSYQFGGPLAVRVGVGNAFGGGGPGRGSSMFLEGFEIAYRPHPSFFLNLQYQDVRSQLQSSPYLSPFDTRYGLLGR
jgi:hypothetical protein